MNLIVFAMWTCLKVLKKMMLKSFMPASFSWLVFLRFAGNGISISVLCLYAKILFVKMTVIFFIKALAAKQFFKILKRILNMWFRSGANLKAPKFIFR